MNAVGADPPDGCRVKLDLALLAATGFGIWQEQLQARQIDRVKIIDIRKYLFILKRK